MTRLRKCWHWRGYLCCNGEGWSDGGGKKHTITMSIIEDPHV